MTTDILMPALSPTMEEGTLAKWLVKEGDIVQSGDLIAEIETDKATMEFESADEGKMGRILIPEGTEGVKVNTLIAVLLDEGETTDDITDQANSVEETHADVKPQDSGASSSPSSVQPVTAISSKDRIFASPLARRIATQKGIDLASLSGSGPHGRIIKADVESARPGTAAALPSAPLTARPSATQTEPAFDMISTIYADRETEIVRLDGMRKTIAARLCEAKQTIPHFYLRRDIRIDNLLKTRSKINRELESRNVKLSVNDFIIKACAMALQAAPDCNAVWAGDHILKIKPSDVAVAVAIEGGLFTPVLRDADQKTLSVLSMEMKDLAGRARERKLAPHEYQGGSFAISNLGMFGIDNFDAVINPPHSAILAVGSGLKKPVSDDEGNLTAATVMSVTLSVDHRVIDGALGSELLKHIVQYLENPMTMLV
ncbi:MAG: pyruvate dehydrogenase complex dihydrolipoamide acetyltransferase [Roseovarius sp.]|nr:pyruvate dehydrogenase complex dihydrolipoamide acetyltransferase [Roseovarius sp.]